LPPSRLGSPIGQFFPSGATARYEARYETRDEARDEARVALWRRGFARTA
jgi:hypothetical protein